MVKAYSYVRMSTSEQVKGDSARRQIESSEKFIKSQGWELTERIDDHGISAFRGKNYEIGKLADFIELVKKGRVEKGSYLVIESLDRLTRQNVFTAIGNLSEIVSLGINIVTLADGQVYTKESLENNGLSIIVAAVTLLRSHEESQMKSRRLSSAWEQKRTNMRNGKISTQVLPKWLKYSEDNLKIELIQERADLIREIFSLTISGWGAYSIAKKFNDAGIATWGKSKHWAESYIKKIIDNRAVLGEFQPMKSIYDGYAKSRIVSGDTLKKYFPSVIDAAVFEDAKLSKQKRRTTGKGRKGVNFPNIFSGLLKCNSCGSGIRFINKGQPPKGGTYLKCSQAVLTSRCSFHPIGYSKVEEKIIKIIKNINFDTLLKGTEWEGKLHDFKKEFVENQNQISDLDKKINNLAMAIAEKGPSPSLMDVLTDFENEKQNLARKNALISEKIANLDVGEFRDPSILLDKLNDKNIPREDLLQLRRKVSAEIRKYVKKIRVYSDDIATLDGLAVCDVYKPNIKLSIYIEYMNNTLHIYEEEDDFNGILDEKIGGILSLDIKAAKHGS